MSDLNIDDLNVDDIDDLTEKEKKLYKKGFFDGVRVIKAVFDIIDTTQRVIWSGDPEEMEKLLEIIDKED